VSSLWVASTHPVELEEIKPQFVAFSARTPMSGVSLDGHEIRKGAASAVEAYVQALGGYPLENVKNRVQQISKAGGNPLVVSRDSSVLGVIEVKDIVKGGIKERFAELRQMGIKTIMITGNNPLTAAAIAAEAGVDDFLAEATPLGYKLLVTMIKHSNKVLTHQLIPSSVLKFSASNKSLCLRVD